MKPIMIFALSLATGCSGVVVDDAVDSRPSDGLTPDQPSLVMHEDDVLSRSDEVDLYSAPPPSDNEEPCCAHEDPATCPPEKPMCEPDPEPQPCCDKEDPSECPDDKPVCEPDNVCCEPWDQECPAASPICGEETQ